MRPAPAKLARTVAAVLLAALLSLPAPAGHAGPVAQRDDRLDQPLLAANLCGAGDPSDVHFTLAATGDTFPHENIQAVGESQGYDRLFDSVRPFLKAADLAYTNFDGAMLEGSPYTGYPAFNYNPKLAAALKSAGIGLVSTANNHIMDRGPEGLDATLKVLEQHGIAQHGSVPSSATDRPRPIYLPITLARGDAGVKLAFLSFSWGTNGIPDPYNQVNLLWQSNVYGQQRGIRQEVLDAIGQARRAADVVVVAAHWGFEYQFYPDAAQIEGARQMAAAGADVILGAQAHTLQPIDILDTNGRKTLVIYSLANFLASQGTLQSRYFSATSTIVYVGLVRHADGQVRVTGYRYLPTIHVENDTRPAPIPPQGYEDVIAHVRQEMRDPGGLRQISSDPATLGRRVEVCPSISLPGGQVLAGDFAQLYTTLGGGTAPRPLADALAVFGAPLGPPRPEPAADCRATTVLTTERQRLELHPELDWPFRVAGAQVGDAVYRRKYAAGDVPRRTNLAGDAIADARFKAFFDAYGGLPAFGYPISGLLAEPDAATGQTKTVQYFERARFELIADAPPSAGLLEQVRLAALTREAPGAAACPSAAPESRAGAPSTRVPAPTPRKAVAGSPAHTALTPVVARPWWLWPLVGFQSLLLLGVVAWCLHVRAATRRWQMLEARARRRLASRRTRRRPSGADDELLRRLLGQ